MSIVAVVSPDSSTGGCSAYRLTHNVLVGFSPQKILAGNLPLFPDTWVSATWQLPSSKCEKEGK